MQSSIRKKRNSASFRCLTKRALASFSVAIFLSFSSCSNLKVKSNKEIGPSLAALCLSGKGKGRLEYGQSRYVFNYQSLLDKEKMLWSLGFDLPVIGQEILHLNYDKRSATGTFAKRLAIEIKTEKRKLLLNNLYTDLSELLKMASQPKSIDASGWSYKEDDRGFILEKGALRLKAFSFDDQHYKRTMISYAMQEEKRRDDLVLHLFSSSCR